MKRFLLIIAGAALLAAPLYGQTNNGGEGASMPPKTGAVGGKGADGKLHSFSTSNTGALNISGLPAVGQTTMSASLPVTLASDQPAVPVSGTVTVTATATTVASTALEASHILKASAGSLVSVHGFNAKASAQYILIMNSASVPSDGAVTLLYPPIYVPATSNFSLNFTIPLTASTGISISNSSTGSFTKTIGSADCVFVAQVQ